MATKERTFHMTVIDDGLQPVVDVGMEMANQASAHWTGHVGAEVTVALACLIASGVAEGLDRDVLYTMVDNLVAGRALDYGADETEQAN